MERKPLEYLARLVERYPALRECETEIRQAYEMLAQTYESGGKVLVCGNGGSAADAEHICGELMKGFLKKRPLNEGLKQELLAIDQEMGTYLGQNLQQGLPAIPLYNIGLFTAWLNDAPPEMVYAQQVVALGKPGDVIWGISTSGNARNVLYALIAGSAMGLKTLGLTGDTGGAMAAYCGTVIKVPSAHTPDIQEYHLPVYHCICKMVEEAFFEK